MIDVKKVEDFEKLTDSLNSIATAIENMPTPTGGVDYSINEQNVGIKWIDGKDIYFKTIQLGTTIETNSWFNIEPHNNIYDRIITAYASGTDYSTTLSTAHNDATYLEGRTPYAIPINTITIYYTKL